MLSDEELTAIEARCATATPGPWRAQRGNGCKWRVEQAGHTVCKVWTHNMSKNAPFIAHARTDIPRLLDTIAALTAENGVLRGAADKWAASDRILDSVSHMVSPESEIGQYIRRERGDA